MWQCVDPRVSGVGPGTPLPLARSQYDVPERLAEMDRLGVSDHAVSLPPFLFCSTADDAEFAQGIVARANDELAAYVAQAPDRLVALGSVPLGWPGAVGEARRCLEALGTRGIAIGTRGAGRELDDRHPVKTVEALGLDAAATRAILWDNAAAMVASS